MSKHKLRMQHVIGDGPKAQIYFQCQRCQAGISIEREVMRKIVITGKVPWVEADLVPWKECKGV